MVVRPVADQSTPRGRGPGNAAVADSRIRARCSWASVALPAALMDDVRRTLLEEVGMVIDWQGVSGRANAAVQSEDGALAPELSAVHVQRARGSDCGVRQRAWMLAISSLDTVSCGPYAVTEVLTIVVGFLFLGCLG